MLLIIKEFEKKIIALGFSYSSSKEGSYLLHDENDINLSINVRLIESKSPDTQIHGSKIGIDIQAIGLFKFKQIKTEPKPDFFIFTFRNSSKNLHEYLIIPEEELERRVIKSNFGFNHDKRIKIVFWLMTDGTIYNKTDISIEGEWYLLSKGVCGRMADGTFWDFTDFLNEWGRLRNS